MFFCVHKTEATEKVKKRGCAWAGINKKIIIMWLKVSRTTPLSHLIVKVYVPAMPLLIETAALLII